MNKDKFNASGCMDLTAYAALSNIEKEEYKYLPIVYIASPYRGAVEINVMRARRYSHFAVTQDTIPITPHLLYPQFMNDDNPSERKLAMRFNYVLLGLCKELWVFGDEITEGMAYEIGIAKKRFMKIRYFDVNCKEVKYDSI